MATLLKLCTSCIERTLPSTCKTGRYFSTNINIYLSAPQDKQTHTGQQWKDDDKRLVRFVDREKQVNSQFAIDLIATVAPLGSTSRVVSCDGGGGPLGHPKVYINLDQPGNHTCGYCGLRFYKEGHH